MSLKLNFLDEEEPTLKIRMPLVDNRPEPEGVRVGVMMFIVLILKSKLEKT